MNQNDEILEHLDNGMSEFFTPERLTEFLDVLHRKFHGQLITLIPLGNTTWMVRVEKLAD